jgi:hypothetical protein
VRRPSCDSDATSTFGFQVPDSRPENPVSRLGPETKSEIRTWSCRVGLSGFEWAHTRKRMDQASIFDVEPLVDRPSLLIVMVQLLLVSLWSTGVWTVWRLGEEEA